MAIITDKPTGRPNTAYKGKYLELKKKYEKLLEVKVGLVEAPVEEIETLFEENDIQTSKAKSEVKALKVDTEANSLDTSENPLKELEMIEENIEEAPAKEKINPDDYDFRCSECLELFNREGNEVEGGIKCPDCGKVYSNG